MRWLLFAVSPFALSLSCDTDPGSLSALVGGNSSENADAENSLSDEWDGLNEERATQYG